MIKGGYQIINLKNVALSDSAVNVEGVYETIEGNYYKPLLLSGIYIDGKEMADIYVTATVEAGNYVISAYGGIITITANDEITFTKNV